MLKRSLYTSVFCTFFVFNSSFAAEEKALELEKGHDFVQSEHISRLENRIEQLENLIQKMETQIKDSVYAKISDTVGREIQNQSQAIESQITSNVENNLNRDIDGKLEDKLSKAKVHFIDEAMAARLANMMPAAGPDQAIVTLKNGLKIESQDGQYSFQPFGRILADYGFFNDDNTDHPDGGNFRAARIGVKGKLGDRFGYKLETDFGGESVNVRDAYVSYAPNDKNLSVRVGSIKPPLSLENVASISDITFIERASPTLAFADGWLIGADVNAHTDTWTATAALQNDNVGTQSSDDEAWQAGVRGTARPWLENDSFVHLGGAYSYRVPDSANELARFNSKAENSIQNTQSIDTGAAGLTNTDNFTVLGLEGALNLDNFLWQSEYYYTDVSRSVGSDTSFDGWYTQVSYLFSNDVRPYDTARGVFRKVKPKKGFDPEKGTWGAFELAARYSNTDLTDSSITGGEMENYTLGLNWHLNNNLRLKSNYIIVDTDNNAVTADDDPDIFLMRAQVDF